MSNNPHHEAAEKRLRNGTINEVARAGVEATLALAYEQRTANLIALFGEGFAGGQVHHAEVFKQIQERLGLS